jgi:hypothetical protein
MIPSQPTLLRTRTIYYVYVVYETTWLGKARELAFPTTKFCSTRRIFSGVER